MNRLKCSSQLDSTETPDTGLYWGQRRALQLGGGAASVAGMLPALAGCVEWSDEGSSQGAVFLLAQNRLLREALSRILTNKSDIEICGALSPDSLHETVAVAPALLVIDSLTTNHTTLDLAREVQQSLPDIRPVMMGGRPAVVAAGVEQRSQPIRIRLFGTWRVRCARS